MKVKKENTSEAQPSQSCGSLAALLHGHLVNRGFLAQVYKEALDKQHKYRTQSDQQFTKLDKSLPERRKPHSSVAHLQWQSENLLSSLNSGGHRHSYTDLVKLNFTDAIESL